MQFSKLQSCLDNFIGRPNKALLYYDTQILSRNLNRINTSFPPTSQHAVAIKTNPHPDVLKFIIKSGYSLEAASIEEVELALGLGIKTEKIIFDSPAKTKDEIDFFQNNCVGGLLNANCLDELKRIPAKPSFKLGLRVNPIIDSGAPEEYNVSTKFSKFGVPINNKKEISNALLRYPISCLHMHIGSDITELERTANAIGLLKSLADSYNTIDSLDIGGGLPAEKSLENNLLTSYISYIQNHINDIAKYKFITEFGRYYHQNAGIFISEVEYVLQRSGKQIPIIHAGADLFLREVYIKKPRHYTLVFDRNGNQKRTNPVQTDIGGPLCFAADYIEKNALLPEMEEGDIIVMLECGANNWGMWSRHCSRKPIDMIVI